VTGRSKLQTLAGATFFSLGICAELLWGPPSLMFNGHWSYFQSGRGGGGTCQGVKLTFHLSKAPQHTFIAQTRKIFI